MFGWDINKLVEEATALVNDAQQDIASWDRREDATEATASADPAGGPLQVAPFSKQRDNLKRDPMCLLDVWRG